MIKLMKMMGAFLIALCAGEAGLISVLKIAEHYNVDPNSAGLAFAILYGLMFFVMLIAVAID